FPSEFQYVRRHPTRTKCSHLPSVKRWSRLRQSGHSRKRFLYTPCTDDKLSFCSFRAKLESQIWIDFLQLSCKLVKDPFLIPFKIEQLITMFSEPFPKLLLTSHF